MNGAGNPPPLGALISTRFSVRRREAFQLLFFSMKNLK